MVSCGSPCRWIWLFENVFIPLLENDVREADGSVTITIEPDTGRSYTPSVG